MDRAYAAHDRLGRTGHVHPPTDGAAVAELLRSARRDPSKVVLEGAHALKHALRFGADVEAVATPDATALDALLTAVAPDVAAEVRRRAVHLDAATWEQAVGRTLPSPAASVAVRPSTSVAEVLAAPGLVVVLEDPRHLGNLGAVIRVAAAADAGGVLVVGDADPWHPIAVRGAAGLQFALPVVRTDVLPDTDRPLIALDGEGEPLQPGSVPRDAALLVGTERGGLSSELLDRAGGRVAIPMRVGVASLNLATAVAIALYAA
jgi:RNA methyltransferase, TrmH family